MFSISFGDGQSLADWKDCHICPRDNIRHHQYRGWRTDARCIRNGILLYQHSWIEPGNCGDAISFSGSINLIVRHLSQKTNLAFTSIILLSWVIGLADANINSHKKNNLKFHNERLHFRELNPISCTWKKRFFSSINSGSLGNYLKCIKIASYRSADQLSSTSNSIWRAAYLMRKMRVLSVNGFMCGSRAGLQLLLLIIIYQITR